MKCCLHCEHPAAFSVCAVISTLGLKGRRQTCTTSLPFCSACLQQIWANAEGNAAPRLRQALQAAFQALTAQPVERSEQATELQTGEQTGSRDPHAVLSFQRREWEPAPEKD